MTDLHPHLTSAPALRVGPSPIHARGVFAACDLNTDDTLEAGTVLVFPDGEPEDGSHLNDYVFDLDGTLSCLVLGVTSLCNHDLDPNAAVDIDADALTFELYALRPIRAGEEVVIDYGEDYWAVR